MSNAPKILETKTIVILTASFLILVILSLALLFYLFMYEDWHMERLSRVHEQGARFLADWRKAKEILKDDPNEAGAYFTVGFVKGEFGELEEAEQAYLKAIELVPEEVDYLRGLAVFYVKTSNYSKAEEYYKKGLEIDPADTAVLNGMIDLYHNYYSEKRSETETILLRALEVAPDDQNLLSLLASYYISAGQKEKGIEVYEKILSLRPDDQLLRKGIEKLKEK